MREDSEPRLETDEAEEIDDFRCVKSALHSYGWSIVPAWYDTKLAPAVELLQAQRATRPQASTVPPSEINMVNERRGSQIQPPACEKEAIGRLGLW